MRGCVCVCVCVWALTFPPRWVTPAVGWRLLESLGCKPCSPPCRGACKGGNSLERWPWWYRGPPRGTSHAYRSQVCLPKPARDKAVSERQPPGSEILLRQFFPLHTCEGESSLTPSVILYEGLLRENTDGNLGVSKYWWLVCFSRAHCCRC